MPLIVYRVWKVTIVWANIFFIPSLSLSLSLPYLIDALSRNAVKGSFSALAIGVTPSIGETHNSIPKRDAQWGGNYATEFATSRPPKARCPNRKWIKSIEVQFRSWVADIIGNSAIMIMVGNSGHKIQIEGGNARRSDRDRGGVGRGRGGWRTRRGRGEGDSRANWDC